MLLLCSNAAGPMIKPVIVDTAKNSHALKKTAVDSVLPCGREWG